MKGAVVGLGLDSVDIARFAAVLRRRPTFTNRVFTDGERAYAATLVNPTPTLAARFAVKEAVMKALGVGLGGFGWGDVEVLRTDGGAPLLTVTGRAAQLASERGVGGWHLSITHTESTASAVVVAVS